MYCLLSIIISYILQMILTMFKSVRPDKATNLFVEALVIDLDL